MQYRLTKFDIWGAAVGIFASLSQVVLLRESLSVAGGNELSTALAFAGWFLGVAFGASVSRRSARVFGAPVPLSAVACGLAVAGFALLRLHRVWLHVGIGEAASLGGTAGTLLLGLGLGGTAMGGLFTLTALRLPADALAPVSRLFAAESLGAVVGSAFFYFALADAASHALSAGIAAAVLFFGATFVSGRFSRILAAVSVALFATAAAGGWLSHLDTVLEKIAFRTLSDTTFVATAQSPYGRLSLSSDAGQYALWVDGRFDLAFPDPYDRPVSVHAALSEHPAPDAVLMLGGGPTDRLEAALSHGPKKVVLTYLNEKKATFCAPFQPPSTAAALRDPRVRTVHEDGRRYIAGAETRFDVIIVSAAPPKSAGENRFHTASFYRDIRRILKPGGLVAAIAPGGANVLSEEAAVSAASSLATIRTQFPEVMIIPGLDTMILASVDKGVLSTNPAVLAERFKKRGVTATGFSSARFSDLLDPGRRASALARLRRAPARINTDEMPVVYAANLSMWERGLGGADQHAAEDTVTAVLLRNAAVFFVVPVLMFILWRILRRRRGLSFKARAILSVGGTGAAGMASQIVIMLVFQASFGTLYSSIALLTGAFMLGAALGGISARRFLIGGRVRDALLVDAFVIGYLLLSGPVLQGAGTSAWVFYGWSLIGGGLTGLAFPVCLRTAARDERNDERAVAAAVERADHLGAAFGAFVTGLVWIPCYGVTAACLLFGALKLLGASAWLQRSHVAH